MPTLGGFLKKKRTKDSADPSTDSAVSSEGLKYVPTNSSQTSNSLHRPETASSTTQPAEEKPTQQDASVAAQQQSQLANQPATSQVDGSNDMPATPAAGSGQQVTPQVRQTKGKYTLPDFTIQRTLGTGSFGRVHLVQSKHNQRFYAIKVLKKAQVVKMKQVEHTNDERRMLQRVKHPFLITLWGTFSDSKNLYMVMDFVEGGELFSLLRKSQVGASSAALYTFIDLRAVLNSRVEVSQPGCQILCSRSHPCS